jgi:hypothetical protein
VLDNVAAILAESGAGLEDVIKATVHLADLTLFPGFDRSYSARFSQPRPARTTVASGLMGILVEIDVIAADPHAPAPVPVLALPNHLAPDPRATAQQYLGLAVFWMVEPGTASAGMARSSIGSRDGSADLIHPGCPPASQPHP